MRFLYYDRVLGMEKGRSIVGVKTFSLSEEFLGKHFRKSPVVPGVIFIEAMAQLLGWLIIYSNDFSLSAIMSLISGVKVPSMLRPGFSAEIHGEILSMSRRDSLGRAAVYVDGREVASIERIIYAHTQKVDGDRLRQLFRYYGGEWGMSENGGESS